MTTLYYVFINELNFEVFEAGTFSFLIQYCAFIKIVCINLYGLVMIINI